MPNSYDPDRQTIDNLLANRPSPITVPDYQRSYSWKTKQVSEFWDDLIEFYREKNFNNGPQEYFLGSAVIVETGKQETLLDGQQRLATSTILFSVLRDELAKVSPSSANELQQSFIAVKRFGEEARNNLVLNGDDREFFSREIQQYPREDVVPHKAERASHGNIRKAKQLLSKKLEEYLSQHTNSDQEKKRFIESFTRCLADDVTVIAIKTSSANEAEIVFETLNERGIGLSAQDLLKNYLMRKSEDENARDNVAKSWTTIGQTLGELSSSTDLTEQYLRHFWTSYYGDVKSTRLYQAIKSRVGKNKTYQAEDGPHWSVKDFTSELTRQVTTYESIVTADSAHEGINQHLTLMKSCGAKLLYSPMLAALDTVYNTDRSQVYRFSENLLKYYLRNSVIAGLEMAAVESSALQMARKIRLEGNLRSSLEQIERDIVSLDAVYRRMLELSVPKVGHANAILRVIENDLQNSEELAISGTGSVHLEHILPKKPNSDWDGIFENPESQVNRIGNLTLLSKSLNTSIKNSGFPKKLLRYTESRMKLTTQLEKYSHWDVDAINDRSEWLARQACRALALDGESEPSEKDFIDWSRG